MERCHFAAGEQVSVGSPNLCIRALLDFKPFLLLVTVQHLAQATLGCL